MSITTVSPVYDLGTRADYLEFGVGVKKKGHKAADTNRLAPGFYSDAPNIDVFIALGNQLAEGHGRKVKAHSYVLSFSPDELDVKDPDDLTRAGDLGFLLAKKMRPNSPAMVVVHDDGKGGCVHAHITVLNHDTVTGKAPRDYRVHWQVKRANDELMREEGMQVLSPVPMTSEGYWAAKRGDMAVFDQQVGDAITEAALDSSTVDMATFTAACESRGVEVIAAGHKVKNDGYRGKKQGDTAIGITYKMRDNSTPGKEPRMRRRKASALSPEFTATGLDEIFTRKQELKEQQHGNHGRARTAAPTAGTERTATDFGEIERVVRPARRNRDKPTRSSQGHQRGIEECEPGVGRVGTDAAVDAAADALRRLRERLAREDADNGSQGTEGDPGVAGRPEKREAHRRIERKRWGPVSARANAESDDADRGTADNDGYGLG